MCLGGRGHCRPKAFSDESGSNSPQERLNRLIRRRARVFTDRTALVRLIGTVPAEQYDERTGMLGYIGRERLKRSRLIVANGDAEQRRK